MSVTTCPHCGQRRNTSNAYTSPTNVERDMKFWNEVHLSGHCAKNQSETTTNDSVSESANTSDTAEQLFSLAQITEALNRAADDIVDQADADNTVTDATNLMVNAGVHYLTHPADELLDAIQANYDSEVDEVLSWINH